VKKQVNPLITATALLVALGAVLFVYTKGLLHKPEPAAGGAAGGGGGGGTDPPVGLQSVTVSTLAGWASPGLVDGTGWTAKFNGPAGLALAPDGSLYVSDSRNHRIRRVTPAGVVLTVAGSGPVDCLPGGYADGPAGQARFFNPAGLCAAPEGTLYIADAGNHRVRQLRDGRVTTIVGRETPKDELGFEQGGRQAGPVAQALLKYPVAVARTPTGELLIADLGNQALRRLADGTLTTHALSAMQRLSAPTGVLVAGSAVFVADADTPKLAAWEPGGVGPAGNLTGVAPRCPTGLARLPDGSLVVVDGEWNAVFAVTPSGSSTLLAGVLPAGGPAHGARDGTGAEALFSGACAVCAADWTLYVADFGNNCIRKLEIPPDWATPPPPPLDARQQRWQQHGRRPGKRDGDRSAD